MSKKRASKKRPRAAAPPKAKVAAEPVTCRHPLTEITAAVNSLWSYDKIMANPESRAAGRQAGNAFDIAVAVLRREVERIALWRKTGEYCTVQG